MYAPCQACGLKTVMLYTKTNHSRMVNNSSEPPAKEDSEVNDVNLLTLQSGTSMLDTGCKAAGGGTGWHLQMQKELRKRGNAVYCEPQAEYFELDLEIRSGWIAFGSTLLAYRARTQS